MTRHGAPVALAWAVAAACAGGSAADAPCDCPDDARDTDVRGGGTVETDGTPDVDEDTDHAADTDPGADTDACTVGLGAGQCPPSFTLPRVGGGDAGWQDFPGHRVVVFGSSLWCPVCRSVAQDLAAWTPPDDVVILDVLVEDDAGDPPTLADAERWKTGLDLPFDVLADPEHAWADAWSTGGHRHTYTVIGADGRVAWHVDGYRSATADDVIAAVQAAEDGAGTSR